MTLGIQPLGVGSLGASQQEETQALEVVQLPKALHPDFAQKGIKPIGDSVVDQSNPISERLSSYGLSLYDFAHRIKVNYYANPASQVSDYIHFNDSRNDETILLDSLGNTWADGATELTCIVNCRFHGGDGVAEHSLLGQWADMQGASGGDDPKRVMMRYENNGGTTQIEIFGFDSSDKSLTVTQDMDDGLFHTVTVLIRGGELKFNYDGVTDAGATAISTLQSATHSFFPEVMGGHASTQGGSDAPQFDLKWWGFWDRALSDRELLELHRDPYQVLKPAVPMSYFVPAAAGVFMPLSKTIHPDFIEKNTKPIGSVEIDWNNPLSKGLTGYWGFDKFKNLVPWNIDLTEVGTVVYSSNRYEMGSDPLNNRMEISHDDIADLYNASRNFSVLCVVEFTSLVDSQAFWSNGSNGLEIYKHSTDVIALDDDSQANLTTGNESIVVGKKYNILVTVSSDATANLNIYINGKLDKTDTTAVDLTPAHSGMQIGMAANDGHPMTNGIVYMTAYFNRELSQGEAIELTENPYQTLKPKTPILHPFLDSVIGQIQAQYRFGKDDGSESAHTWHAGLNTDISVSGDTVAVLRIQVENTGDFPSQQMKIQVKKTSDPDTEYRDIPVA